MAIGTPVTLGSADSNPAATTATLVTSAAAAAASRVIVTVSYWRSATQTISGISDGAAYTLDKRVVHSNGNDVLEVWSRHATAGLASGSTITVTWTARPTGAALIGAAYVTGLASSSAVDTTGQNSATGTGWSSGAATNSVNDALFWGASGSENVGSTTSTPTAGTTEVHDRWRAADGQGFATGYIIAASQASRSVAGTFSTSSTANTGALVIYKAAVSATTYDRSGATIAAATPAVSVVKTRDRSAAVASAAAPAASRVRVRVIDRSGPVASEGALKGSQSKVNPTTHHGTITFGRIQPIRSGMVVLEAAVAGSRSVGSATSYARSGVIVSAGAPSVSRAVTGVGTTFTRSGTVAAGHVPTDRSGQVVSARVMSGNRILGSPGATFDRSGLMISGRAAFNRSGATVSAAAPSGSRALTPHGTIDRSGGGAGGIGGASSGGLLLTLVNHPGPTMSASVHVDSNVPLRTGSVTSAAQPAASRSSQRDRSATVISASVAIGNRVSSGNRNRNGMVMTEPALVGSVVKIRRSDVSAAVVSSVDVSASAGTQFAVVYARQALFTTGMVLSGRSGRVSDVITYISFGAPSGRVVVGPTGRL